MQTVPGNRQIAVSVPASLADAVERVRFERSLERGRRVTLREVVEQALITLVQRPSVKSDLNA
jgi:hypothetical protein